LSDDQIRGLDFYSLTEEQVENIFFSGNLTEKLARITALAPQTIEKMIHRRLFKVLQYISDDQLSKVEMKNVTSEFIELLFPALDPSKWHPRLAYSVETDSRGQKRHVWGNSTGSSSRTAGEEIFNWEMQQKQALC